MKKVINVSTSDPNHEKNEKVRPPQNWEWCYQKGYNDKMKNQSRKSWEENLRKGEESYR